MAVPKRKLSKSRTAKRRAQWKLVAPTVVACENCRQPKLPHRACPECGFYAGRQVLKVKAEAAGK